MILTILLRFPVKLLDWGEEGNRSESEVAALRAAFSQEVSVWHKLDHPNVTKVHVLNIKIAPFYYFYENLIQVIHIFCPFTDVPFRCNGKY